MTEKRRLLYSRCKTKLVSLEYTYRSLLNLNFNQKNNEKNIDDLEQETSLSSRAIQLLPEIERALDRIKNGTYGLCEISGLEIEEKRLLAVPWTRVSMQALVDEIA